MRPCSVSRYSGNVSKPSNGMPLNADGVHALDAGEQLDEPVAVAGPQRRDGEPAVAGDHRRDAVEAARRGVRLERELRVVVGVRVDDAGGHHLPVGVDLAGAGLLHEADLGDAAVLDGDVGPPPRQPRAVHHDAVADHQIEGGHRSARIEHVLVLSNSLDPIPLACSSHLSESARR